MQRHCQTIGPWRSGSPRQRKPPTDMLGAQLHIMLPQSKNIFEQSSLLFRTTQWNRYDNVLSNLHRASADIFAWNRHSCWKKRNTNLLAVTQSLKRMPWMCNWKCFTASLLIKLWSRHKLVYRLCVRKFVHCSFKLNNLLNCCWSVQHPLVLQSAALVHLEDSKHGFEITWLRSDLTTLQFATYIKTF